MEHTPSELLAALMFIVGVMLIAIPAIVLAFTWHPAAGIIGVGICMVLAALFIIKGES